MRCGSTSRSVARSTGRPMSAVEPIPLDEPTDAMLMAERHQEVAEAWERIQHREQSLVRLANTYAAVLKADIEYDLALVRGALNLDTKKTPRWG